MKRIRKKIVVGLCLGAVALAAAPAQDEAVLKRIQTAGRIQI